jgi:2,5-diamino-6-(ribosylamino)-4(3H)-pyrimidinone 5'-phosphate reductase
MSADGKIALPTGKQLRISSDEDIIRMYQLRNEHDAVLVGVNTVLSDNPKLTVKEKYVPYPRQPLRVILDSTGKTPKNALVLNNAAPTLLVTALGNEKEFSEEHIEMIGCKTDKDGRIDLKSMLKLLYTKGVKKLLVEGGGTVIWNFLKQKLVDDLYIYMGPCIIGGNHTSTVADGTGIKNKDELIPLRVVKVDRLGEGILVHYTLIQ